MAAEEVSQVLLPEYLSNEIYGMQQLQKRLELNRLTATHSDYRLDEFQDILEDLMRSHIELMSIAKQIIER